MDIVRDDLAFGIIVSVPMPGEQNAPFLSENYKI